MSCAREDECSDVGISYTYFFIINFVVIITLLTLLVYGRWRVLFLVCVQEIPPPGSYNVQQSYDKSQVHIDIAKPRTEAANRKHTSFMSASSRFAPPRDNVVKAKTGVDPDNPGTS